MEKKKNKDLRSHLEIQLGTSREESRTLTNLRCRRHPTPVSNVCEATPISLFYCVLWPVGCDCKLHLLERREKPCKQSRLLPSWIRWRKGGSAWFASSLWSRRNTKFLTSQSRFLSSNWLFRVRVHPFNRELSTWRSWLITNGMAGCAELDRGRGLRAKCKSVSKTTWNHHEVFTCAMAVVLQKYFRLASVVPKPSGA